MSSSARQLRFADQKSSQGSLPSEITSRTSQRLAFLAVTVAAISLVQFVAKLLAQAMTDDTEMVAPTSPAGAAVVIGLSIAVAVISRKRLVSDRAIINIGFVYAICIAAAMSIVTVQMPWWTNEHVFAGVPWTCVWLVLFPLVVPISMHRTVTIVFAMAATIPIALALAPHLFDVPHPAPQVFFKVSVEAGICAMFAILPARVLHNLGRALKKARALGSYNLETLLGKGGMGEVWLARHRMLVRPAAVKLIKGELFGELEEGKRKNLHDRFRREAQATAALRSPHTVQLYDYGISDDGTFYYAMELLDGMDLKQLVERHGVVPPERVVHILEQACRSLADAHEHGVIHRDIKPSNIFLCRLGGELDYVKVLDFGLVHLESDEDEDVHLTSENAIVGTPAYIAPEVALGERDIDGRVDVYALGCIGYWLLVGELVFSASTPGTMAASHAARKPVPPSKRGEVEVPEALESVIMSCLVKDPVDRPTAAALGDMLRSCTLDSGWSSQRARDWWSSLP